MEKNLLKKSGIIAVIITFSALAFWFGFAKLSLGAYNEKNLTKQFLAEDSKAFKTLVIEVGSDTVARIIAGTSSMTLTGTSSYQYQPRIQYDGVTGLWSFKNSGGTETTAIGTVTASYVAAEIGSTTANYVLKTNGSSTGQLATDATLAGQGTITASFRVNGLDISPPELSMVDGATVPLNTVTGSVTNHTHTGSDGTTQVSHTNLTNKGTQTHTQIDNFISSKAAASGVASLDANSLVVQNPASGTSTPGASKTVMSDGTGKILDGWLSNNVTKLGTPTTDNIAEGSTNKYHTDARVNATIGSSSITSPQVSPRITFTSPAAGQFLKIVDAQGNVENGTSSVSVDFSAVTGSATASQLPLISGLLGSATASQLPTVIRLPGTTTEQVAGAFGQLYNFQSYRTLTTSQYATDSNVKVLLHFNGTDTSTTFTDYSTFNRTASVFGAAQLDTSVVLVNNACGQFTGAGDYISFPDFDFPSGTSSFTTNQVVRLASYTANETPLWSYHVYAVASGIQLLYNNSTNVIRFYDEVAASNVVSGNFKMATNANYCVELTRDGNNFYLFAGTATVGGTINLIGTATNSVSLANPSISFKIGRFSDSDAGYDLLGRVDEFYMSSTPLHTSSFLFTGDELILNLYTQYSAKYKDPVNGNTVLEILTHGTVSTEASYIYNNATTTVFGLGTNTAITATSTAYSGWFDGAVRATAFNVASTEKIKENIKPIKIKPDLLDAEGMAKNNYINTQKTVWITDNIDNYTYVGTGTPSGTITTYVDNVAMERDYDNYIELAWAADLNQDTYTETIQKTYEKGFWQMFDSVAPRSWNPKDKPSLTRKGFVVEDMPDVVKGDDGQSIDPMALIAYISLVQQTLKADTIFALSTLKELLTTGTVTQQNIEYCNDRLEVLSP